MARCPRCQRTFRVLEDEDPADHGCPRCGYTGRPRCLWCGAELETAEYSPYCSSRCEELATQEASS